MPEYPEAWLRQGDINGDGKIDTEDLLIFARFYKRPASECPNADLDGDGWISILDLEKFTRSYQSYHTYEDWVLAVKNRIKKGVTITGFTAAIPIIIASIVSR